jgi:uncharacterized membrane protein YfcA
VDTYLLFFGATVVAGAINALGGGGGLITFTLLLLVVPPVTADATSAVALWAAYPTAVWRTRDEVRGVVRGKGLRMLLIPSLLGGLLGALLLSWSGSRNLVELVPWLMLVATLLILLRPLLVRRSDSDIQQPNYAPWLRVVAVVVTFLMALYGGYFGAGVGILMISLFSLMGLGHIHQVVALKNLLACSLRGVAVLVLIIEGTVDWGYGLPMALGGLVGGYLAGEVSGRANPTVIRGIVIIIGFSTAVYYFWRLYGTSIPYIGGE